MTDASGDTDSVNLLLRLFSTGLALWLVFLAPPATLLALLSGQMFHEYWLTSLWFLPLPVLLVISVFRLRSARWRWWVFQYLGVSAVAFSAALCAALLSLFIDERLAGQLGVLLFVIFMIMAVLAAHRIHVVPLNIRSRKIQKPVRLVQISDVHIGSRPAGFLERVVRQVNEQKPDALLITGDLIDEDVPAESLQALAGLDFPVFYCSGNHERYVSYRQALDIIANHGVNVLSDSAAFLRDLHIMGIGDRQHVHEADEVLARLRSSSVGQEASFTILLYHQPDLWRSAVNHGIDLMLSGHTHKGQIWPFGWLVRIRYKHVAGHFRSALSHLFVSQGTGTWGPTLRFGTRCEMTLIELLPEEV